MNFTETLEALELTLYSGSVPLIIGESGIGKTALIRKFAEDNGFALVSLDANLLKEGEIGGLPTVEKGRTIYATHNKLVEVEENVKKLGKCVLFVDEINRCDHAVQQELMNLILNREINGYVLNDNVFVAAAMNPSSRIEEFKDTNYQVVDMDPAQENRFVWLKMDSDPKEWIIWGIGEGNIHPKVIEFISSFQDYLKFRGRDEFIEATPRSWERISNALKIYEKNAFREGTLYNFVKGNVGTKIASDFITYLKEDKSGAVSAKDVLSMEVLSQSVKDYIGEASHSGLYILLMNLVREVMEKDKENNINPITDPNSDCNTNTNLNKDIERIGEVLMLYPRDLRISLMKEIRQMYLDTIYKKLLNNDVFLNAFYDAYVH